MSAASNRQESIRSRVAYGRQLVGSGVEGASAAARHALGDQSANQMLAAAARSSWKIGVAGALAGLVAGALRKRPAGHVLLNGLAAGAAAFGAGMIWSSQELTSAAARGAVRGVNTARDMRWLEENPINYA